jgi:hypothetical protein
VDSQCGRTPEWLRSGKGQPLDVNPLRCRRVHASCGRPVHDASFGLNDFFDSPAPSKQSQAPPRAAGAPREDAIEPDAAFMEDDVGHLWTCPWCTVECGLAGTLPQLVLDVAIADDSGN